MGKWLVAAAVTMSVVLLGGGIASVRADPSAPADTPDTEEVAPPDLAGRIAEGLADPLGDRLGETLRQTFTSLFPPVWRDPESAAATVGLGAANSLTHTLQAPMAWAWHWMLSVPDSIQPDPGSEVDRAFAAVPGGSVVRDFFVPSRANLALRAMWERTRDLALNASTPLVSLVVAIFVGFALYKVFVGAPVDLRAFAGQTAVAIGFALASYVMVESLLQLNNLLVQAFIAVGGDAINRQSPLELYQRWGWDEAGTTGVFEGIWINLFRTLLYLVLLVEVALLALKFALRLIWIWVLVVAAPIVMVLSLLPFARGLMDAWVKRVAQVVFEKAAIVFGLVVVFGVIAAQPPSLLSIAMLIVSLGVVLQFPRWLMAGLAQLPSITPQSVWGRGVHHYITARSLLRDARTVRGGRGVMRGPGQ
ncbi:MAG: hypothetical protein OXQ29_04860 [Rhodospirillaceae bacterium]|nr:hypothetical protein [Rhodospirillaceae bacterium]